MDDSDAVFKEDLLREKSIDNEAIMKNFEQLTNCRFYSAILAGCIAGIFSLTGLYGLLFYVINFIVFTFALYSFLQFKRGCFFISKLTPAHHGFFTHAMVN